MIMMSSSQPRLAWPCSSWLGRFAACCCCLGGRPNGSRLAFLSQAAAATDAAAAAARRLPCLAESLNERLVYSFARMAKTHQKLDLKKIVKKRLVIFMPDNSLINFQYEEMIGNVVHLLEENS